MFSGILFFICGVLVGGAILYMYLHKRRVKIQDTPDDPVSKSQFDKEEGTYEG